ncbi:hypothetical protein ACJJTC_003746 [Scirpophaga incertulas]
MYGFYIFYAAFASGHPAHRFMATYSFALFTIWNVGPSKARYATAWICGVSSPFFRYLLITDIHLKRGLPRPLGWVLMSSTDLVMWAGGRRMTWPNHLRRLS